MIENINHQTELFCPDSDNDSVMALQVSFWIDEGNVWHVDCEVCGGEHCIGEVMANQEIQRIEKSR